MLKEYVSRNCTCKRYYGFAYRDFSRDQIIAYPIPLNFVIGWLRFFYYWLLLKMSRDFAKKFYDQAYEKGFEEGRKIRCR